jgi:2-dehydro-3-deoxygluconokinase
VTTVQPEELDTERISRSDVFHTSGITPALSPTVEQTTATLLRSAAESDTTVSFDLNYRSKLWSPSAAREAIEPLLGTVDILFAPKRDTERVLGIDSEPGEMARTLADTHDIGTVIVTMGSDGALAYHEGDQFEQPVYPASDRRPIGTGDAFVGGFLAAFHEERDVETALSWGAATAALKRSIPGDVATVTPEEVREVLDGATREISR